MRYPEMVKTNNRYRGPMESRKQTDSIKDIERSLSLAADELYKRREESRKLMGNLLNTYNHVLPNDRKEVVNGVRSVRGGEL